MINFPISPTLNQQYTAGDRTWKCVQVGPPAIWDIVPVGTADAVAAGNSAIAAAASATAAATSETNAGSSATLAQDWAIKTSGPVSGGEYSAKWWAQSIAAGPVASWIGLTGVIGLSAAKTALALVKADVGLSNVDNTADTAKPVSTAQATAIGLKSDTATTVTKDSDTGAANIPVGTSAQRPTATLGKFRINSDTSRAEMGNGTSFVSLGGATGGGNDAAFYLNDSTINNDYTIPSGSNAGTFGPVTIASGKTITVSSGSTWSIV